MTCMWKEITEKEAWSEIRIPQYVKMIMFEISSESTRE